MNVHADSFFSIGRAHVMNGKPCQDYAMTEVSGDGKFAFAVVSDGCSSGRNTDIGSRLLVLATAQTVREYWDSGEDVTLFSTIDALAKRQARLREARLLLGLVQDDMLATSMFACVSPYCGLVRVQGDGVVALKYRDGSIAMTRYEWPGNAPFYPAREEEDMEVFLQSHGGDAQAKVVRACSWTMDPTGVLARVSNELLSIDAGIRGFQTFFSVADEIEFVAIFSDGVAQVSNIDWKDAVRSFLDFKTTIGPFAKKRMNAGIKESTAVGKGPIDDISYAVIHIINDEAEGGVS
ncbi:MAG: protein phosphatase 2C domain-containing protein [Candidatus Paceibacterota bacterium]|jgi:hypothetical protein